MYISNKFHFETTQEYNIENANCENLWIKLQNPKNKANYVIKVAYRHPTSKNDDFIHAVNSSTDQIAISNQSLYLSGDFNIDTAPNATNSFSDKLINMLLSNKCHAIITIPTRFSNSLSLIIRASFCWIKKLHLVLTKVAKSCSYLQTLNTTVIYSSDLFFYNAKYLQTLLGEKWRSFANSLGAC